MESFEIAHINEQGVDLILIPLNNSFGYKTQNEQNQITKKLQACAISARLKGTVIPIWIDSLNRMKFIAPQNYFPFLESINYDFVLANINKKLTCAYI